MKRLEQLTHRVTFRGGIIVFAAMLVLALSSTFARRVGLAVIAASVVGVPSAAVAAASESNGTAIRPFKFHASDEALADLRRRLAATKWPSPELVTDGSQGVQFATIRELARYWQADYDWRKVEAKLDALPNSSRTSTVWTSTSSTFARNTRMRCRSSSPTGGPARSSSS